MNTKVCEDCAYSFVNKNGNCNRRCKLYNQLEIRNIVKCPIGCSEKDIEWIEQKEQEDKERGYVLYSFAVKDTICDEEV